MTTQSGQPRDILSVSQLNRKARQLLETHLPLLWVEGEISNLTKHTSGHWYFTLKDEKAQISCAMFRSRNALVQWNPQRGQQALVRGRISLYEPRGNYQLIAEHMEEAGHGALQRAFEQLKAKLEAEGLFLPEHKRPLPSLAKHIGVITSPSGAAIRDILAVLARRFPGIPVSIIPVTVQGKEAAAQLVGAIEMANQRPLAQQTSERPPLDVLVLSRGGGSLEDLWAFNEEAVARAIFASTLPIVSAVGHEIDFTIADFVADVRAATPSAAAELLSPDGDDWLQTFAGYEILLTQAILRCIAKCQQGVDNFRSRLRHPGQHLQAQAQHLDNLEMRLRHCTRAQLQQRQAALEQASLRQQRLHPQQLISAYRQRLQALFDRLNTRVKTKLTSTQERVASLAQVLNAVSPLNVLGRGYGIVSDAKGNIISDAAQVSAGDNVSAQLAKGVLKCRVQQSVPTKT